jgi:hypothetical protein
MDERRFDAFAKAITQHSATRRTSTRHLFAVAAAVPTLGTGLDALARKKRGKRKYRKPLRCSGDSCDGTGGKRCGDRDDCQCYRAADGGNVCAGSLQSSCAASCQTNKDCPKGHVCVEGGPACCGGGVRFCKRACYK